MMGFVGAYLRVCPIGGIEAESWGEEKNNGPFEVSTIAEK